MIFFNSHSYECMCISVWTVCLGEGVVGLSTVGSSSYLTVAVGEGVCVGTGMGIGMGIGMGMGWVQV